MGPAIAPVLCAMVANTAEFILLKHFRTAMNSAGLRNGFRYADNRAFLLSEGNVTNPWRHLLHHLEFYGSPIILENVSGRSVFGPTCSIQQGAIIVRQPVRRCHHAENVEVSWQSATRRVIVRIHVRWL